MPYYPDWSEESERVIRSAGWYPGRREIELVNAWQSALPEFQLSEAAARALEEFGGLRVENNSGSGLELARGGFVLEPLRAVGESYRFAPHAERVHGDLYPLGEITNGFGFLGIDQVGWVFLIGEDELYLQAKTVPAALHAIVVGLAPTSV